MKSVDKLWIVFEPLMFGLIGAEVKMEYMSARLIGTLSRPLNIFPAGQLVLMQIL